MSDSATSKPQTKRSLPLRILRGLGLALLWTVLIVVILLAATLDVLRRPGAQEKLREIVLQQTSAIVPGLRLRGLSGDFTSHLGLHGLVLADRFGGEAIQVEHLLLSYDLSALTSRTLHVKEIRIVGPKVVVKPAKSGKLNLAELVVPSDEPEPPPSDEPLAWSARLDALRIERGQAVVDLGKGQTLKVQDLDLHVTAAAKGVPEAARLQFRRFSARVTLPDDRQVKLSLAGHAGIEGTRLDSVLRLQSEGLLPSREGKVSLSTRVGGTLDRITLGLEVGLPRKASVSLDGWAADLLSGAPRFHLDLKLAHLDPSQLMQGLIPADVNLGLVASGQGIPMQPKSRLKAALRVTPSTVRGIGLDSLALDAGLEEKMWSVSRLELRAGPLTLKAGGTGTMESVDGKLDLRLRQLARLPRELKREAKLPPLRGRLRVKGRVKGKFVGPLQVNAVVDGQELEVEGRRVGQVSIRAALKGLPHAPDGSVRVEAAGIDPGVPNLAIKHLEAVVKGDRRHLELVSARVEALGGAIEAAGHFRPKGFPRAEARVRLQRIRIPGRPQRVSGTVRADLGRRTLEASVGLRLLPYNTDLKLAATVPVRYPGGGLAPTIRFKEPAKVSLHVKNVALKMVNALARGLPKLTGSAEVNAEVEGTIARPTGDVNVTVRDASVLGFEGIGLSHRLSVRPQQVSVRTEAALARRPIVQVESELNVVVEDLIRRLRSRAGLGRAAVVQLLKETPVKLSVKVPSTPLPFLGKQQKIVEIVPILGKARGSLMASVEVKGTIDRSEARIRAGLKDAWLDTLDLGDHQTDLSLKVRPGRTEVVLSEHHDGKLLIRTAGHTPVDPVMLMQGRALPAAPLKAWVEIRPYKLSQLRRFDPRLAKVDGTLVGSVTITGTIKEPRASAVLRLHKTRFGPAQLGDLVTKASFTKDRKGPTLDASLKLKQPGGGGLTGKVGLRIKPGELTARIKGQAIDLGVLHKLVPAVRESAGKLSLDLRAKGKLTKPKVAGTVQLDRGKLRLRGMSELSGLALKLRIDPNGVRLDHLAARSGKGLLTASGKVGLKDLKPTAFALRASANRFRVDAGPVQNAVFSGRVDVDGRMSESELQTKVKITDGVLKVPKIEGQRELHAAGELEDVVFVGQREEPKTAERGSGERAEAAPLKPRTKTKTKTKQALHLVASADPFFMRGEELDLEVHTNVKVKSDSEGRPRIHGQVGIRRGKIKVLGNDFEVRQALVSFSGEEKPDPALNILLARRIQDATIFIALTGTASEPELALRSDPPIYDNAQIVSLILTGRVDPRASEGGGDQSMAIAGAVTNVLVGGLARKIAPKVGLDVARVNLGESKDEETGESSLRAEVEVGKYITERLYIGYRRVVGAQEDENTNEGLAEFRISAQWLLMAVFGDKGVGGLDLVWSYRY